jgi:4-carboxymuconolactone decarboxylase
MQDGSSNKPPFKRVEMAMTRLPMIPEDKLTEDQRRAVQAVTAGKRGGVRGPFPALLRSPKLCEKAAVLGEMMRFDTSLPPRLSELAILITAHNWRAQYEWYAHAPMAQKGGLADDIIEAVRVGKRPASMQADEAVVYDLCTELYNTKRVSDATYTRGVDAFGENGVVELLGICGYYVLVSMVLNTAQVALPEGAPLPFPE